MEMSFGEELRRLRKAKGLTQVELAEKVGVSQSFIGNLEGGRNTGASVTVLARLSEALGVPLARLAALVAQPTAPKSKGGKGAFQLPLLGMVPASPPAEALADPDEMFDFRAAFGGDGRFMLRVKGDSMIDEQIRSGDFVIVRVQPEAQNGEKVVAMVDGEMTLKKLIRRTREVRLAYCDGRKQFIILDEGRGDRIIGALVGVVRKG